MNNHFNTVSTHTSQVQFQHTHFRCSFDVHISSTVSTHTHTHTLQKKKGENGFLQTLSVDDADTKICNTPPVGATSSKENSNTTGVPICVRKIEQENKGNPNPYTNSHQEILRNKLNENPKFMSSRIMDPNSHEQPKLGSNHHPVVLSWHDQGTGELTSTLGQAVYSAAWYRHIISNYYFN